MNVPKITVVMPSFNQAAYLESAIESVLSQNYPNLEFILLDGGSSDDSKAIINRYVDHFFYWRSSPDNGQAAALKEGFDMATGDIYCWLNSDDVFLPNAFKAVADAFSKNVKADFIYSDRKVINASGDVVDEHVWPFYLLEYHWAYGQPLAQECCFWRADLYRKVGGINPDLFFIMDYDLFLRMWKVGSFKKIYPHLACIRFHEESKNATSQEVLKREIANAKERYQVKQPGYFMLRFLNRFNSLQILFERWFRHIHIV